MTTTPPTSPKSPALPAPPSPYIAARVHASKHRVELEASERCGCFFCFRIFATTDIKTWVDSDQTALCPHCGIDSVIGSAYCRIGDQFLRRMHQHHFAYRSR
jgi:hypothetical protein